jgi:antitoxin CcdA
MAKARKSMTHSPTANLELATTAARSGKDNWLAENRASLLAWNEWVRQNGMPYDEYRQLDGI